MSSNGTTPSKKKQDDENDEATALAWKKGQQNRQVQKARRVKVWLKNSVKTLASPSHVEFENSPSKKGRRKDPASKPATFSSSQQQSLSSRRPSSTTTSSKTTTTIDQAMFSLYTYTGPKKKLLGTSVVTVEPETPSSYVPNYDYDWILDGGREDWRQEEQTSVEYLKYLEDPWDMESYIQNYLQDHEAKLQQELKEDDEAFQFEAKFDESALSTAEPMAKEEELPTSYNENESEDVFGEFEEPTTDPLATEENTEEEDDDDFGDFQGADDNDNVDSCHAQVESEIDNWLQTPPSGKDKEKVTLGDQQRQEVSGQLFQEGADQEEQIDDAPVPEPSGNDEEKVTHIDDAPIPEVSDGNTSDDVSSLGSNGSVDADEDDNEETMTQNDGDRESGNMEKGKDSHHMVESQNEEEPVESSYNAAGNVPTYSPGSIGESIFALSYRDEELESTEDELIAEANEILQSCPSTADDTPAREGPKPSGLECKAKEQERQQQQHNVTHGEADQEGCTGGFEQSKAVGQVGALPESGSASIKQQESNEAPSIDKFPEGDASGTGTIRGADSPLHDQSATAMSPECEDIVDENRHAKPTDDTDAVASSISTKNDVGDEEEDFGDFCEAPPVSNITLSAAPEDALPETQGSDDDDNFGDFQGSAVFRDPYPVDSSPTGNEPEVPQSSTVLSLGNGVTQLSYSREAPNPGAFAPTFAVLPPLNVDPADESQQEVAATSSSQQRQHANHQTSFPETPGQATMNQQELNDSDIFSVGSDITSPHDIPISLRLPITNLSTPEARFARRQGQKHQRVLKAKRNNESQLQPSASLADFDDDIAYVLDENEELTSIANLDIPQYYFTQPDLDDTVRVLQSAPWHHVSHLWQDSDEEGDVGELKIASAYSFEDQLDRRALWEQYLTDELCRLDTAQNQVSKHLLHQIRPHAPTLNVANRSIHEFATNLQLSQMYLTRSQAAIRQAARGTYDHQQEEFECYGGWDGAHELLQAWERQEMYRLFQATLTQIQDILDTEKSLHNCVENFTFDNEDPKKYSSLIRQVEQLRESVLSNDALTRLHALSDLRGRLYHKSLLLDFHRRLHTLAESVAVRCCRRRQLVARDEYQALLEAAVQVRESVVPHEAQSGANDKSYADTEETPSSISLEPSRLSATWPQTVLQALCYEANRALAAALLDPLMMDDTSADSEYERELTGLAYDIQQDWGDSAKLRTVTHNLIIIRFDWESSYRYFLPVYHRLCLILADVLYAHKTFAQWHGQLVKDCERQTHRDVEDDGKEEKSETSEQLGTHESPQPKLRPLLEEIRIGWLNSREVLWKCCEGVLIKLLEEYLHFACHKSLFQRNDNSNLNDGGSVSRSNSQKDSSQYSEWRRDLEDLHSVLVLTEQFVSIKGRFFEDETSNSWASVDGDLREKLCDVFRKHLRHVHVEAMKSLGMSLSQEKWELVSLKHLSDYEPNASSLTALMGLALTEASETIDKVGADQLSQSQRRNTVKCTRRSLFRRQGNQFLIPSCEASDDLFANDCEADGDGCQAMGSVDLESSREVYDLINNVLAGGDCGNPLSRVASESTVKVFFSWVARLLLVMERLPLIVEDISAVFANLCDLYFTTVFRLCVGSAVNERLLLGMDSPAQPSFDSEPYAPITPEKPKPPSSPPLFGFRRRSSSGSIGVTRRKPNVSKVEIPTTLEADICSPIKSEMLGLKHTREFFRRAQKSLQDIVILDKVDHWISDPVIVGASPEDNDKIVVQAIRNLEMRLGSAWSCLSIAAMLDATCNVARNKLSKSAFGRRFVEDLSTLEHYTQAVFQMVPQLVRLSSRISCVRAILAKRIVLEILKVGRGWEEPKLNEHPNDYIDALCGRYACVWAALTVSKKRLPSGVLKITWEDMIRGAFETLLEGFSKVPFCSTEGRALMSMDLASFAAGVSPSSVMERLEYDVQYEAPPKVDPHHGMQYLDTYIKVFYYPKEDVMDWIRENYENYHLNHCLTLAANAFRSHVGGDDDGNGIPVEVALEAVKNIYQDRSSEEPGAGAD